MTRVAAIAFSVLVLALLSSVIAQDRNPARPTPAGDPYAPRVGWGNPPASQPAASQPTAATRPTNPVSRDPREIEAPARTWREDSPLRGPVVDDVPPPRTANRGTNRATLAPPSSFPYGNPAAGGSAVAGPASAGAFAPDREAAPIDADQGTGVPGAKELDGPQAPTVVVEKVAPAEMRVGQKATYEIKVRNAGQSPAQGVQVIEELPRGCRLVGTTPRAIADERGRIVWDLGTLRPGSGTSVKVEVLPLREGALGSVAVVQFRAEASARTMVTQPQLSIKSTAAKQLLAGQQTKLSISISNSGSGPATGLILEADLSKELIHEAGHELQFSVGTLKPQETRRIELPIAAEKAGKGIAQLTIRADGGAKTQEIIPIDVVAPQLEVVIKGRTKRYLDRKATYTLTIANAGNAAAKEVELVSYLPRGMKFVEADHSGTYDKAEHAVVWSLEELKADKQGEVMLTLLPVESGEQKLRVEARSATGGEDRSEESITVEGVAGLSFQVVDKNDPVEVGGDAVYEVHVQNTGSKEATHVQVAVTLPKQLRGVEAQGPTKHELRGQLITFEPIAKLAPKDRKTFVIKTQALEAGDVRISVQVQGDDQSQPITQQEGTRIFAAEDE